jgi:hypothetical protein
MVRVAKRPIVLHLQQEQDTFNLNVEKCYTVCQSPWQNTAMVPGRRYDGADDCIYILHVNLRYFKGKSSVSILHKS